MSCNSGPRKASTTLSEPHEARRPIVSDRAEGREVSSRAEGPTARSTGVAFGCLRFAPAQPCVRRCRETRPERSPASFDPTFAADLSGRGFVGRFLGLACGCLRFAPAQAQQHPDKTLVGRISRGFDFLGDDFSPAGMTGMSRRSVEKFAKRVALLAEQGADAVGIGQTVRPWLRWTSAGLDGCLRWTETQLPLGCESVSGMLLPGGLALDDPDSG